MDMPEVNKFSANWEGWKNFMGRAVEFATELGVSSDQITTLAHKVGNILAENVYPSAPEQKVLKDLWMQADDHEKQTLANLVTRLVSAK
jgi:pantoate kinase